MGRLPQPATGRPALAAFDPEGIIFAACARIEGQGRGQPDCHVLKLFDSKAFGCVRRVELDAWLRRRGGHAGLSCCLARHVS